MSTPRATPAASTETDPTTPSAAATDARDGAAATATQPDEVRDSVGAELFKLGKRIGLVGTGIDFSRLVAAGPHNFRNGTRGLWLYSMVPMVGPGPNTKVVPYQTGMWRTAYRASNSIGPITTALGAVTSITNIVEGVREDGPAGLVTTKAGRTGVISSVGLGMAFGVLGASMLQGRGSGVRGMLMSGIDSPLRGNIKVGLIGAALSPLIFLNESGTFDFLDSGSDLGAAESVTNGVLNLPRTVAKIMVPFI